MKRFIFATVFISMVLLIQLSFASPMAPMATMNIEGRIQKISWHADKFMKSLPGMSGNAGEDRTISAHYKVTLIETKVTSTKNGYVPFTSEETIDIEINHEKDDKFLKLNMNVRIIGFRLRGDEGGVNTSFERIEVL